MSPTLCLNPPCTSFLKKGVIPPLLVAITTANTHIVLKKPE